MDGQLAECMDGRVDGLAAKLTVSVEFVPGNFAGSLAAIRADDGKPRTVQVVTLERQWKGNGTCEKKYLFIYDFFHFILYEFGFDS